MLIKLVLLLGAFALLVYVTGYFFLKIKRESEEGYQLKDKNSDRMYCMDCDKIFYTEQSIKTQAGVYPCPFCAGKNTVQDTLASTKQKFLGQSEQNENS
jgi:hypothetical protein